MRLFKICLFFSLVSFCCVPLILASDNGEYWGTCTFSVKVDEKVKLNLLEEFRLKSDKGFYVYVQYAGASYKINDYFDTALWYKLVSSKKDQHWSESHRFDIDGTLKLNLNELKLSNRSRFERNTTASSWLYRDRVKIEKSIELFNRDFTPFISNEFFLDLEPESGYHENRASGGFKTDFIYSSKLTVYYMARGKKNNGSWNNTNILGTTVGFYF